MSHADNLAVSSRIIDIYLKNIVDLSRMLLNDSECKEVLLSEETDGAYFSATNTRKLEHVLRDLSEQNTYIRGVTVIGSKGQLLFTSKLNYESGKMQPYYRENNILSSRWIPAVQRASGK